MAIGPDGKVTTTGLMDSPTKTPEAPDMSNLKAPAQAQEQKAPPSAGMVQRPEPKDPAIVEKISKVRAHVVAKKVYRLGGLSGVEDKSAPSVDRLEGKFKNFLSLGGWGQKANSRES